LYSFLYHRLSSSGSREVDQTLANYLHEKVQHYGTDRVWKYARRSYLRGSVLSLFWLRFWQGYLLTSVLWFVVGISLDLPGWLLAGLISFIIAGMMTLHMWLSARGKKAGRTRSGRQSSLVICPDGLALCQGDLVGQLRWDEIRSIRIVRTQIQLKLEGAEINISDIYDRPLPLIHQLLLYYYEGERDREQPVWRFDATRLRETDREEARKTGRYTSQRDEYHN
jgi:hypothetical protein